MSESSPLHYEISPQPRPSRAGVWISWPIIIAVIAVILFYSTRAQRRTPTEAGIQLDMVSRYAVGEKSLLGNTESFKSSLSKVSGQVYEAAISSEDHLRIIPVIGELRGADVARFELREFMKTATDPGLIRDASILETIYSETGEKVSPEEAARLQDRHGWYGRLALSFGKDDSDPLRKQVIRDARRTFLTLAGAVVMIGGLVLAGLVVLILLIALWSTKGLRPRYPQMAARPASAAVFVESFAVYMALMLLMAIPPKFIHKLGGLDWDVLLIIPISAAVGWAGLRGIGWTQLRHELGWTRGRGIVREMALGVVGYVAGVPLIALGFLAAAVLGKVSHQQLSHPIVHYIQEAGPHRIMLFVLACIFAPIAEETMFRGFLFGHLRGKFGWVVSALIVSLVFAAIHPQGWPAIPLLGSIAIVLAALREQRGSLIASMTAHMTNNLLAMLMLVLAVG